MGTDLNSKTLGGLVAFYDWLKEKSYLGAHAVEAHKTAINKMFGTVEPDGWESISLDGLDLEDYIRRFRIAAAAKYRAETFDVYASRIRKAIATYQYYLENGRPPAFRQQLRKDGAAEQKKAKLKAVPPSAENVKETPQESGEVFDFTMPLSTGRVLRIPDCPKQWPKADVDRLSAMIRALQAEEQRQLPRTTGESAAA